MINKKVKFKLKKGGEIEMKMDNFLKLLVISGGIAGIAAGYYGLKNKDPKLLGLGLAIGKLLVLGLTTNGKN